MPDALLKDRDYTLIVARTAAHLRQSPPHFEERWISARTAVLALAHRCEEFDPDGITIYISSLDAEGVPFRQYRQVTSAQIEQIFEENYPPETLNLLDGLDLALKDYFAAKAAGTAKPNGAIILVLIDGEPADRMAIVRLIVNATQQMDRDQELGIGFVQIGDDLIARGFLESLDDDLRSRAGAQFDIVNTRVLEQIQPDSLTAFLLDIIQD